VYEDWMQILARQADSVLILMAEAPEVTAHLQV
jgi:predicted O-linked N-acetylglucosamine transferase (SPINDLY family)